MATVLVAMSGGVDSAVAAARLVEAGHDVTGVHLKLADVPLADQVPGQGCCTLDDAQDARRVAQVLDIPFYVWDMGATFVREVQEPFAAQYAAGTTPNPCVTCNERVKYAALLDRARALGFDALATGHHVRLRTPDGAPVTTPTAGARLHRAADPRKDQTYVLYVATPDQLAHSLFPVGELTKDEVRDVAAAHGLRVAGKPDSFDVCFIPDGDTAGYLADRVPATPGPIVDLHGRRLGTHDGVWAFTIGQRRGLGLATETHRRHFVVDLDAGRNTVVVGPRDALACRWLDLDTPSWTTSDGPPTDRDDVTVQLRAHGRPLPARLAHGPDDRWRVHLDEPAHGVAVGQAAVLYGVERGSEQEGVERGSEQDGGVCLGGGRIAAAQRPERSTRGAQSPPVSTSSTR